MSKGSFLFPALTEEKIPPAAFGYWSIRWSAELADKTLTDLSSGSFEGCSTYMNSYLTGLQLLALYASSYWAYAIYMLGTPAECIEEMKIGMNDYIKEYGGPNGGVISNELIAVFDSFFKRSLRAISDDLGEDSKPGAFNPDINNVAKSFVEALEFYHFRDGNVMPEIEKTYIGHQIADIQLNMFNALKSQGLTFNA